MFKGRRLLIATKHKKETVLGPLFDEGLDVQSFVPENFNTDIFGTFSGEVERKEGAVTTVRNKCLEALEIYGCDLGIASEGSFGSHPSIPFTRANEEIVIFIDKKNDLEIIANKLELETNFSAREVKTWKELVEFAQRGKFSSHALILRASENDTKAIFKGISDWKLLKLCYENLKKENETIYVETDMRALYNPTRMKVIQKAGQELLNKIKSCCPKCHSPGFGVTEVQSGLLCDWCGSATRSTLSYIYECKKCSFKREEEYPHGKYREDPMYCDLCNP